MFSAIEDLPTGALTDELRRRGLAVIVWGAEDVESIRPDWTDEQCAEGLLNVRTQFQDRCVEQGWDTLDNLLGP
jgi:hypothetical protein